MEDRAVEKSWCSVCARWDLLTRKWRGQLWVYCPTNADGPEDAHTAFPVKKYAKVRWELERVPIDISQHSELNEALVEEIAGEAPEELALEE